MGEWLRRRSMEPVVSHRCDMPLFYSLSMTDISDRDIYRCSCGRIWEVDVDQQDWYLVRGIRAWWWRRQPSLAIKDKDVNFLPKQVPGGAFDVHSFRSSTEEVREPRLPIQDVPVQHSRTDVS